MKRRINSGLVLGFVAGLAVAIACSAKSMSGSQAIDASAISDVAADTAAGPAPDRLRTRTADTDIDQQEEGETVLQPAALDVVAVAGPIMITDIWTPEITSIASLVISLHANSTCDAAITRPHMSERELVGARVLPLHGIRLAVKAGEFLCARSSGAVLRWSGYRPYPAS